MKNMLIIVFACISVSVFGRGTKVKEAADPTDAVQKQTVDEIESRLSSLEAETGIQLIKNGVREVYTDIDLAWPNIESGTTLILPEGITEADSPLGGLGSMSNITIRGSGSKLSVLKAHPAVGADQSVFKFYHAQSLQLKGVTFWGVANDADYGSGHIYNLYLSCEGTAEDCVALFENNLTYMDAGKSAKCVVQVAEGYKFFYDNCTIAQINASASVPSYTMAHHDTKVTDNVYNECNFIAQNSEIGTVGGAVLLTGFNRANTGNLLTVDYMTFKQAQLLLPEAAQGLLNESSFVNHAYSISPRVIEFTAICETGTLYRTIAEFDEEPTGSVGYNVRIDAVAYRAGSGSIYPYHADLFIKSGVVSTNTLDDKTYAVLKFSAGTGTAPDSFQILERTNGRDWASGTITLTPMRYVFSDESKADSQQMKLQLFDVRP